MAIVERIAVSECGGAKIERESNRNSALSVLQSEWAAECSREKFIAVRARRPIGGLNIASCEWIFI
jgi:hypothetical protein